MAYMERSDIIQSLRSLHLEQESVLSRPSASVLPDVDDIERATTSLLDHLPSAGYGLEKTTDHLVQDIAKALNASSLSPNYYGFVTGGVTPAATIADGLVSLYDQNVHVHLPDETIVTVVEDRALTMLMELIDLDPKDWQGRTFTTGATASNIIGLACGREFVLAKAHERISSTDAGQDTAGELGILQLCRKVGIEQIQVLTTMPHSSIRKAASVVGLGRSSVIDVGEGDKSLVFDMRKLEYELSRPKSVSIVVISCGEVNTGRFATYRLQEVVEIKRLCDQYGAWLHVDGAFGIFARALKGPEFKRVSDGPRYMELAHSITGDAHKLLNVPYDCGFFFCRIPDMNWRVFHNPNAAYLSTRKHALDTIPSPLNLGMENSRRFRGLTVYATLMAYGRVGYVDMFERQVRLARAVAQWLHGHEMFDTLPEDLQASQGALQEIYIIVLFRAKDVALNKQLVQKINESTKMYVSGTLWNGEPACRLAVANWQVKIENDFATIKGVLTNVIRDWQGNSSSTGSHC